MRIDDKKTKKEDLKKKMIADKVQKELEQDEHKTELEKLAEYMKSKVK